jgi:hypothetical protein
MFSEEMMVYFMSGKNHSPGLLYKLRKNIFIPFIFITARRAGCFLFAMLIPIIGAYAEGNIFNKPITEAGLARMLPALRSESWEIKGEKMAASPENSHVGDEIVSLIDSVYRAADAIKSGELNPLEWLSAYSRYMAVPDGVTYDLDASRTESGWNGVPTAIFTFGNAASPFELAVIQNDVKTLVGMYTQGIIDSISLKMNSIIEAADTFYRNRNFISTGMTGPLSWSLVSPDSSLIIGLYEANILLSHGCTTLPTGPLIEISCWRISGMDGDLSKMASPELPFILERTGISVDEYFNFKSEMSFARDDAQNPERLKLGSNNPPKSADAKETFEKASQMMEVRKMNAELYRRYAGILDPLLSSFETKK